MSNDIAPPEAQSGTAPPTETPVETVTPPTPEAQSGTPAEVHDGERPDRARERIEELSARAKAGIEYGEFWRQRFEESQQPTASTPTDDPRPKRGDFEDDDAWADALTTWTERRAESRAEVAAEKRFAKAREEERLRGLHGSFAARAAEFAKAKPDFQTVVSNPALTFFNGQFMEVAMASEKGPDLLYHIGRNPELVARLAGQSIPQRLATLGRIEADLSRPPPPPKPSAAPPPLNPIGGGGSGGAKDPSKMTAQEFLRWRLESRAAKK